jgi:hypothetical protein
MLFVDVNLVEDELCVTRLYMKFGMVAGIAQSVQRLATGWTTEGPEYESL